MMQSLSYRNALIGAVMFHVLIAFMLMYESTSKHPVLMATNNPAHSEEHPTAIQPNNEPIKAVSVNSDEVMKTVNHLKEERLHQQQAEEKRQRMLTQQAEAARLRRVAEQQHLEKLKEESAQIAIKRQKQMEEEQLHLKQLAKQKEAEEKKLAEMKSQQLQMQKQQEQEKNKLVELQKKKAVELARANEAKDAKAKEDLAQKQRAAAEQAAVNAAKSAQMAGEVDKYKALIIGAISRQWILPENANSSMSSQFRIRLAPNGVVLEVSLTRSSGDPILDRSAQSAIYKASPLPVPNDPQTFNLFRDISLTVRPESARG